MTRAEWLTLRVGDVLVDHMSGDAERTVLSVSRVTGRRGQRAGLTRTTITLDNLRGSHLRPVTVSNNDDLRGERFSLRDS